jgi:hypothetical protein
MRHTIPRKASNTVHALIDRLSALLRSEAQTYSHIEIPNRRGGTPRKNLILAVYVIPGAAMRENMLANRNKRPKTRRSISDACFGGLLDSDTPPIASRRKIVRSQI